MDFPGETFRVLKNKEEKQLGQMAYRLRSRRLLIERLVGRRTVNERPIGRDLVAGKRGTVRLFRKRREKGDSPRGRWSFFPSPETACGSLGAKVSQVDTPFGQYRTRRPLGPDVRNFRAAIRPGENGLFVSMGGFTSEALREPETQGSPLTLMDRDQFVDLLTEHYHSLEPEFQAMVPLKKVYIPVTVG